MKIDNLLVKLDAYMERMDAGRTSIGRTCIELFQRCLGSEEEIRWERHPQMRHEGGGHNGSKSYAWHPMAPRYSKMGKEEEL